VERICNEVTGLLDSAEGVLIQLKSGSMQVATHVFDSRLPFEYQTGSADYPCVLQHFGGWVVRFDEAVFDPEVFTMMDFNQRFQDTCSFTYILPENARQGLVEFTFFSPQLVDQHVYEAQVDSYLRQQFPGKSFVVLEKEFGVIPMSDFPFHRYNTQTVTCIGTGGGWVKPSTGYSFRNAERYIDKIIHNLKAGNLPSAGVHSARHRFYDSLFVHRLQHENSIGHTLFTVMYRRNPIDRIFRFLDEESTLGDDLRIMSTFKPWPFMRLIGLKLVNAVFKRRRT